MKKQPLTQTKTNHPNKKEIEKEVKGIGL